MIDLRDIKHYANDHLQGSTFTTVMMSEPDEICESDCRSKISTWFSILKMEGETALEGVQLAEQSTARATRSRHTNV